MNINFELYKIFYVVANNKSISKGAEVLMISQPAVTQAIKNLENQLETTLFSRTKKGIILTSEGEELYHYVKEGMNYFINGTNKLQELKNLETGAITIGASTSITENYLMPYINKFTTLHPNIDIKIVNNLTDTLLKELRNGNLDIVIGSKSTKDNLDLKFKELSKIHYIFVSNKKESPTLKDLLQRKIIIQSNPSVTRTVFEQFLQNNNLNPPPYIEVISHRLVTEFTKNNLGIGFVTKEYIKDDLNKNLYEISINKELPIREIGYTIVNNYTPTHATKKLIELLKENK